MTFRNEGQEGGTGESFDKIRMKRDILRNNQNMCMGLCSYRRFLACKAIGELA